MTCFPYTDALLGENVLCEVADRHTVMVATEYEAVRYAFVEKGDEGERVVVGETVGEWCEKVERFRFSLFPGFFYSTQVNGKRSFSVNGSRGPHENAVIHDVVHGGIPFYTLFDAETGMIPIRSFFGKNELEYIFVGSAHVAQNRNNIVYVGRHVEDRNVLKTMIGTQVFYDGVARPFVISRRDGFWSFMGARGPSYDEWELYLRNKPSGYYIDGRRYNPHYFGVSQDHEHFYHCYLDEETMEEATVVVDGVAWTGQYGIPFIGESSFSNDSKNLALLCSTNRDSTILVVDGTIIHECSAASMVSYHGDVLTWLAEGEDDYTDCYRNGEVVGSFKNMSEDYVCWNETGNNYALIYSDADGYALSVDGRTVWEFDTVPQMGSGYQRSSSDVVFFDDDAEHVYCVGIKDQKLMLFLQRIGRCNKRAVRKENHRINRQ